MEQDKTRQDKTRQDKTRQDKTRQDKTRQDKTRQDKTRQDKTRQDKTRQDKTRQDKTRQDKTRQDKKLYYFSGLKVAKVTDVTFGVNHTVTAQVYDKIGYYGDSDQGSSPLPSDHSDPWGSSGDRRGDPWYWHNDTTSDD